MHAASNLKQLIFKVILPLHLPLSGRQLANARPLKVLQPLCANLLAHTQKIPTSTPSSF